MNPARVLAKKLRRGVSISFCDQTIAFRGGQFTESHMGYCPFAGHGFYESTLSWREVLKLLRAGAFH